MGKTAKKTAEVQTQVQPISHADWLRLDANGLLISMDVGNSTFNMRASGGVSMDVRSEYGPMTDASGFNDPNLLEVVHIAGNWQVFGDSVNTLGSTSEVSDYLDPVRYRSSWYRNLITYGLYRAFRHIRQQEAIVPHVVMSVPAGIYRIKDELEAVKTNVEGLHVVTSLDGWQYTFNIKRENLLVLPEGAGAFFDSALKDPEKFGKGVWGVLDFGYRTLDVTVYRQMTYVADSAHSNHDVGIYQVARRVYAVLGAESEIRLSEVDAAMRADVLNVNGQDYQIGSAKHKAITSLARQASRWSGERMRPYNVSGIILTGGGSPTYREHLDTHTLPKKIEVSADPYAANAAGGLAFLAQIVAKQKE